MKGQTDDAVERCGEQQVFESRHENDDAYEVICSRPVDHDGPHAACTVAEHPAETWSQD